MKLSQAIQLGRQKIDKQLHGATFRVIEGEKSACALGCAYLGVNDYEFDVVKNTPFSTIHSDLTIHFPELNRDSQPEQIIPFSISDKIVAMNDDEGLTLDEIITHLQNQNL